MMYPTFPCSCTVQSTIGQIGGQTVSHYLLWFLYSSSKKLREILETLYETLSYIWI